MFEIDGKRSPVKKFRDTHHMMARMFAMGMRPGEVAERMGYCLSRISVLHGSPAFQAIIGHYREEVDEVWKAGQDEYFTLVRKRMVRAERLLNEQLESAEENEEQIPLRTLLALTSDGADRAGYPKRTVATNVNISMAAQLEKARKRSDKVIDVTPKVIPFKRRI